MDYAEKYSSERCSHFSAGKPCLETNDSTSIGWGAAQIKDEIDSQPPPSGIRPQTAGCPIVDQKCVYELIIWKRGKGIFGQGASNSFDDYIHL